MSGYQTSENSRVRAHTTDFRVLSTHISTTQNVLDLVHRLTATTGTAVGARYEKHEMCPDFAQTAQGMHEKLQEL